MTKLEAQLQLKDRIIQSDKEAKEFMKEELREKAFTIEKLKWLCLEEDPRKRLIGLEILKEEGKL